MLYINFVISFLLNLIFISIPQNTLIIFLILFLSREYNYFKRKNIKKIFLDILIMGAIPSGFFMNLLYYSGDFNTPIRLTLNSIIFFAFVIHIIRYKYYKKEYTSYLSKFDPYETIQEEKLNPRETLTNFDEPFKYETEKYIFTVNNNIIRLKYKHKKRILISSFLLIILVYQFEIYIISKLNLYLYK